MYGRATALGAGTVLNILATTTGSAFVIDAETTASVELDDSGGTRDSTAEAPDADTHLVECCVELAIETFGDSEGGAVETESDLPIAAGLKSSSTAANVMVLAMLSVLGCSVDPGLDADTSRLDTCRTGVRVAREVGVTATRVFDGAAVSMVGGVIITDSTEDGLIARDEVGWDAFMWTPPKHAHNADANVGRCENVAPMADLMVDLTLEDRYAETMTVNSLAFSATLDFPTNPAVEVIPITDGVSLSETGPSVVTVGDRANPERAKEL